MAEIGFDGRVAIITGAGGGIGRQHALELARRGARVVVNDLGGSVTGEGGDAGPAQKVADEIKDLGGEAVADTNSVATPEGGEAIVKTALDAFGTVDILVNNAGILRDKTFHNLTPDLVDPVVQVHLLGAFYVTIPAWKVMREKNYGRVVFTSSSSGLLGNFGQSNYGAAKMGLVGLMRVLAQEGRKYRISANAISPVAKTRMTENLMGDAFEDLDPAAITPVVCWLASEECDTTGEIYSVAGGLVARVFIGLTPGWFNPDLTVEDVRDHWDEIRDMDGFIVPESPADEFVKIGKVLGEGTPGKVS